MMMARYAAANARHQWRRQLWALGHAPPPLNFQQFYLLAQFGLNLTAISNCRVICKISCQQRIALSPSVTKLLVIEQLRHLAMKFAVSASFAPPRNKSWRRHCTTFLQTSFHTFRSLTFSYAGLRTLGVFTLTLILTLTCRGT